ncbi:Cullin repeat-like-containing domain protein [Suillus clintonianus]|uniref:Cullin repeat-like-containing domain protein n=1 Tax=Suillus clintonianus TaxID=1904413 RepID=UPI001B87C7A0|nr:Cullin repeat-like-containing domain protein [Suillus clintonianus]KAG2119370.1 Cullin repeat-like-containing domain protein [Suillus clintonianus]
MIVKGLGTGVLVHGTESDRYTTGVKKISPNSSPSTPTAIDEKTQVGKKTFGIHSCASAWKNILLFHLQSKHTNLFSAILSLIERQRDGETIDQALVKIVRCHSWMQQRCIASQVLANNLLDYLKDAGHTWKKLLRKREHMLIQSNPDFIQETFRRLLNFDKEADLQSMHTLLLHTYNLEPLRKQYEEHAMQAGLAAVVILLGEISEGEDSLDPKAYIDMLLEVCHKYLGTVSTERPASSIHSIRRAESSAFQTFYATQFSKRVLRSISASDESEASKIPKPKEIRGLEYTHKM